VYLDVLEGMARNESVVLDTRSNFTYGLPKKARIPKTKEQWRAMQNTHGKLTNNYAQIDNKTVQIEGDLELADIQPAKADNHNFRYLKPDEVSVRYKALHRSLLLGDPISLATHPTLGCTLNFKQDVLNSTPYCDGAHPTSSSSHNQQGPTKKPSLQQEIIFWVKDSGDRYYPLTWATFAHLYRTKRIAPIRLTSASGWRLFSDEERIFVVPNDFISLPGSPPPLESVALVASSAAAATAAGAEPSVHSVTPAVYYSNSAKILLEPPAPTL
jgi:hypothetical protein